MLRMRRRHFVWFCRPFFLHHRRHPSSTSSATKNIRIIFFFCSIRCRCQHVFRFISIKMWKFLCRVAREAIHVCNARHRRLLWKLWHRKMWLTLTHANTIKRTNSKSKHSENPTFFFFVLPGIRNVIFTLAPCITLSLSYVIQDKYIYFTLNHTASGGLVVSCVATYRKRVRLFYMFYHSAFCYHLNVSHVISPKTQKTRKYAIQFGCLYYINMGPALTGSGNYLSYILLYTCLTQIPCDMNFNSRPH